MIVMHCEIMAKPNLEPVLLRKGPWGSELRIVQLLGNSQSILVEHNSACKFVKSWNKKLLRRLSFGVYDISYCFNFKSGHVLSVGTRNIAVIYHHNICNLQNEVFKFLILS